MRFWMFSGVHLVVTARFTLHTAKRDWFQAKDYCEFLGERLAVLDTEEKIQETR